MSTWRKDRHLARYRQIARVLARHGLGFVVGAVGLERFLPLHQGWLGHPPRPEPYSRPVRLRMALEELGATFIKLGQILSTRADLLPIEYQVELSKLQDAAPPVPTQVIQQTIVNEFGRPIEELFASFDPVPLAAGSIGQVHAATMLDGTEVVIKVRRPGVVREIENDLEILQNLASAAARRSQLAEQYDIVGLSQEFAQTLRAELDYIREGRSAEHFAANFVEERGVHIPQVFWETTTSRVLTLERIRGVKIVDINALDNMGIDRRDLARRAANIILKMIFEDGFFHADPHPGNFFIEPSGRIGLIDFGMTGTVDNRTQEQLVELLLGVTSQDADRLVDTFLELGVARRRIDRKPLRQDLEVLVSRYYGQELGDLDITALLTDSLDVIRRNRLQLPANLALLVKTMLMNEGLGAQLDPRFNMAKVLAPYARRLIIRQYLPTTWLDRAGQAALDLARLGVDLPQQLRRIILELEQGGLEVGVRPEGLEPMLRRLERMTNRITLGIIAAAFINGLAVLLSVYRPPGTEQWIGMLFAAGFTIAVILGAYLAWSIIRSRRS